MLDAIPVHYPNSQRQFLSKQTQQASAISSEEFTSLSLFSFPLRLNDLLLVFPFAKRERYNARDISAKAITTTLTTQIIT